MGFVTLILITLTFTYSLQYETKVLKKGQDIDLSCEDDVAVHWCFPPKYTNPDEPRSAEYVSATTETYSSEVKHKTRLKIVNAIYIYTGYYHCVRNDSDAPCNRKMDNVKSTYYIFIQDPEYPLVVNGYKYMKAYKNEAAVLPCLSTHPNATIKLTKSDVPMQLGKQKDSDLTVTYDQTLGFILQPLTIRDADVYNCIVEKFDENGELFCDVNIAEKSTFVMNPTIMKDSVSVKPNIMAREGSTLKLICRSLQSTYLSSLSFVWNIPNVSKMKRELSDCKHPTYTCKESLLTVTNVTYADAGNYNCTLHTHNLKSDVKTVWVQVIGQNITRINVSSFWKPNIPVAKETNPMRIVVDYTAPESVSIKWYGPDGKELEKNSNKYKIQTTPTQTILNVMNISLHDAGSYKVQLFDKTMIAVWYNETSVIIQDKPEVHLHSPSTLFNPRKNVTFSCEVYSPAPVDIVWTFIKCNLSKHGSCHAGAVIFNKTSIKNFERVYLLNFTLNINEEGILNCVANNTCAKNCGSNVSSQKIYLTELQELNHTLSIINKPDEIVAGSMITLSCAGSAYFFHSYPFWELYDKDLANPHMLFNSSEISIETSRSELTVFSNLTFNNISKALDGYNIMCDVHNSSDAQWLDLNVQDPEKPRIILTNLDKNREVKISEQMNLYCKTEGVPKPKLKWFKDGVAVKNDDTRFKINEKNESLIIRSVIGDHEGMYLCQALNTIGKDERKNQLIVTDKPGLISVELLVTILILVPLLLGLLIFLLVTRHKERKLQRELNLAGLANFEKGAMGNINPELPVDEQADLLPYDKTWEFPVEKLKLGKMLGAGAFGVVMKAEAYGILDDEEKTTVAVKMVKSGADRSYIRALASELKIMTHLGKHLNVVNLLGASTKRLNKMELMVIVEFCRFGNLHNYLIRHRDDFVDHNTGDINLAIGLDKLSRSQSTKSKTTLKHRLLSYSSSLIGGNNSGGSSTELRAPASPAITEVSAVASDMSVVSSPNGETDECLLSSGSGDQPEWRVKYDGDYRDSSIIVCTQNILCWSFQIARGMEYLSSRKVLHGDLAARNVLLADENIVKICDFGLARSMYKSDNYKKKGGGPLPVKWMALESIRDHVFSTQSDVWSFGIVLWELFSLARTPYPGMEANERLLEKLLNGYRMEQPCYSPNAVYKTMLKCWQDKPNNRPCFTELAEELGAMLDDSLRRHFEELNNPYVDMNEQRQSSDYLSMMASPNYRNLVSPSEYVNSPHPSGSDYLNMKSPTSPVSTNGSVFEYTPESGYLRMSANDNIFSPRHAGENPFKFTSTENKKKEAYPMKTMQSRNADNYVNVGSSISNPTYVMTQS